MARKQRKQQKSPMERYTIYDLRGDFPNDEACLEWLKNRRWPNGTYCKQCEKITMHYLIVSRNSFSCQFCGHHVHPTAGTIFHKSSTPLTLWWHAIFLMSQTRGGISAKQVERELGVTYKTAWRMCKLIRKQLDEDKDPFGGNKDVEVDESYFGPKSQEGKRGRGSERKVPVVGVVERNGRIHTEVAPNASKKTLQTIVENTVQPGTTVHTDEWPGYQDLDDAGYNHRVINHSEGQYVMGSIHTQTIDGFWGNFKNGIVGVHHHVSNDYLHLYLAEHAFRYSHRNDVKPMFLSFLDRVALKVGA
jgi:transposase-like protein